MQRGREGPRLDVHRHRARSGRRDIAGAEAFQQAAACDPNVKLDDALSTPAVKQAFNAATGGGGGVVEAPVAKAAGAGAAEALSLATWSALRASNK
jgi:hypothetical protein